jgi:23S rRNA pseudouridine955/2504/2580 synthase
MTILSTAADDQGRRLDRVLRKALPEVPLSLIHRLLREGKILVDGRSQGAAFRIGAAQEIAVPIAVREKAPRGPAPFAGLRIVYESPDLLAADKEAGLPVHGSGKSLDTLVQAYLAPKLPPSLSFRPGPLHRLDRPTSGIVVFSASLRGARYFSALLREGKIRKQYLALVEGRLEQPGFWEDALAREDRRTVVKAGGKPARTGYRPLAWYPAGNRGLPAGAHRNSQGYSLLVLEPGTGRRHQIRAHAAAHGHPLGGDLTYGGRPLPPLSAEPPAFLLHAWKLSPAPDGNGGAAPFLPPLEAPPPDYFLESIEKLFGKGLL